MQLSETSAKARLAHTHIHILFAGFFSRRIAGTFLVSLLKHLWPELLDIYMRYKQSHSESQHQAVNAAQILQCTS